jgi:hypothetical protein
MRIGYYPAINQVLYEAEWVPGHISVCPEDGVVASLWKFGVFKLPWAAAHQRGFIESIGGR